MQHICHLCGLCVVVGFCNVGVGLVMCCLCVGVGFCNVGLCVCVCGFRNVLFVFRCGFSTVCVVCR